MKTHYEPAGESFTWTSHSDVRLRLTPATRVSDSKREPGHVLEVWRALGDPAGSAISWSYEQRFVPAAGEEDGGLRCPRHGVRFTMIERSPEGRRTCPEGDVWRGVIGQRDLVEVR